MKLEQEQEAERQADLNRLHVCVTNATGHVAQLVIQRLACGEVFGKNACLCLHLLDAGDSTVELDVQDFASGSIENVFLTEDPYKAFQKCSAILLLDEPTCHDSLYKKYGGTISDALANGVKVLIAGCSAESVNATISHLHAQDTVFDNLAVLSVNVENQAKSIVAEKLGVLPSDIRDITVWGDPSSKFYVDISQGKVFRLDSAICGPEGFSRPIAEVMYDKQWIEDELQEQIVARRQVMFKVF